MTDQEINDITKKLVHELHITGPLRIPSDITIKNILNSHFNLQSSGALAGSPQYGIFQHMSNPPPIFNLGDKIILLQTCFAGLSGEILTVHSFDFMTNTISCNGGTGKLPWIFNMSENNILFEKYSHPVNIPKVPQWILDSNRGKIKNDVMTNQTCSHLWKVYRGLSYCEDYCTKCNETKNKRGLHD